ncbi:MAG: phage tail tape measure protein, partial [Thiotrichaceae bacterium]|nr:phage tail tape measure protein [Thiotrichaceae bacterium]
MRDVAIRISAIDKATSVISRITGNINQSISRVNKATQQFHKTMEKVANMKLAADGVNSFANSVKNSLTAPVQAGMEFEAMMSKVAAISLTGSLDEQGNKTAEYEKKLQSLTSTAQEWGAKTAWSASQIAEGFSFLGMAGFSTEQIEAATGGMLSAASAAGVGLGETADILSNVGSAMFGKDAANQFNRMADVMTHVATTSNSSLPMLGEAMKYAAPIAATAGVRFETLRGSMAKLHGVGIQSSQA